MIALATSLAVLLSSALGRLRRHRAAAAARPARCHGNACAHRGRAAEGHDADRRVGAPRGRRRREGGGAAVDRAQGDGDPGQRRRGDLRRRSVRARRRARGRPRGLHHACDRLRSRRAESRTRAAGVPGARDRRPASTRPMQPNWTPPCAGPPMRPSSRRRPHAVASSAASRMSRACRPGRPAALRATSTAPSVAVRRRRTGGRRKPAAVSGAARGGRGLCGLVVGAGRQQLSHPAGLLPTGCCRRPGDAAAGPRGHGGHHGRPCGDRGGGRRGVHAGAVTQRGNGAVARP